MDSPEIYLNLCGFLVSLWEWGEKWHLQLVQNDTARMLRRAKSSLWILHEWSLLMCDDYCSPGQQDVCRWRLALLRSTMYLTLLKLCQHPSLCTNWCWGQKVCSMAAARWSLIKLCSVAMILQKPGLWSVSSSLNCSPRCWKSHNTLFISIILCMF